MFDSRALSFIELHGNSYLQKLKAKRIAAEDARLFPRAAQSYKADLSPIESGYTDVLSVFLQR